jgi:transposase-like protein
MLVVETIGRIRREYFVQGKTIREIARDLKLSRNTVRKVLNCRVEEGRGGLRLGQSPRFPSPSSPGNFTPSLS